MLRENAEGQTGAERHHLTVQLDDRAAGEAVAGANLTILSSLVDKSLIYFKGSGRYELHQILKQYAQEKLRDNPAEKAAAEVLALPIYPELKPEQQQYVVDQIAAYFGEKREVRSET